MALKGFPRLLICPCTLIFRTWCKEAAICDPALLRLMRVCQCVCLSVHCHECIKVSFFVVQYVCSCLRACAHTFLHASCQPRPDTGLGQRFSMHVGLCMCVRMSVWPMAGDHWLSRRECCGWSGRQKKKNRQRKEMEGDRRATTSSKRNYMAQNQWSALGQTNTHMHVTLTLSLDIKADMGAVTLLKNMNILFVGKSVLALNLANVWLIYVVGK